MMAIDNCAGISTKEETPDADFHHAHAADLGRREDDQGQPRAGSRGDAEVEQLGVKVVNQWATLGEYDFVSVIEAPDEKAMAKLSVEMGSRGTVMNQTMVAIDPEEFTSSL